MRAYHPPLPAKEVEGDGARRSPGLRVRMISHHPTTPAAFPDSFPVAGGNFLAYSCAAARDLHPLPCLRPAAKTRVPKNISKSNKQCVSNLERHPSEVNRGRIRFSSTPACMTLTTACSGRKLPLDPQR